MTHEERRAEKPPEEWVLEQVLAGKANPDVAPYVIGVSSTELRSMLVGLIHQRAKEQGWPNR
jgi:hypothetical protein